MMPFLAVMRRFLIPGRLHAGSHEQEPWERAYSRPWCAYCPLQTQPFHAIAAIKDTLHPRLMVEVPVDRAGNTGFEIDRRAPAEFALQFGRIDGVAAIVAGSVLHELDQAFALATIRQRPLLIEQSTDGFHHLDVFPLGVAADVVRFSHPTGFQYTPDCAAVVLDIQPVADVPAVAIDRQRFAG